MSAPWPHRRPPPSPARRARRSAHIRRTPSAAPVRTSVPSCSCSPKILPHRHLDVGVGPTALETEAAFSRFVVGLHAQQVLAGRVERGGGADHRALLIDGNARLVEGHVSGTAELVERDGRYLGNGPE